MRKTLILLLSMLALSSCYRRILEDNFLNVIVRATINTDSIRNITSDIYNPAIPVPHIEPDVMHVMFYDQQSGNIVSEAFIQDKEKDSEGRTVISGPVYVGPGRYNMLLYSFGSDYVHIIDNSSYSGVHAMALHRKSSAVIDEQPDHLFVSTSDNEAIPYTEGNYIINTEDFTIVDTYYLQIKIEGLEYVKGAKAVLTSMAGGKFLASKEMITEVSSSLSIDLIKSKDKEADVICNLFNIFGHFDKSVNNLFVTFDIDTIEGKKVERTFDISDLFYTDNALNHNWLLIEETIVIDPPAIPISGGMQPTVDDWEEEEHKIKF